MWKWETLGINQVSIRPINHVPLVGVVVVGFRIPFESGVANRQSFAGIRARYCCVDVDGCLLFFYSYWSWNISGEVI